MNGKTLSEIDAILGRINTHPEYSFHTKRERMEILRVDAARHSADLERRSEELAGVPCEADPKKVLENIDSAWDYLTKNGLDISSFSSLGKLVEPGANKIGSFRTTDVDIGEVPPVLSPEVPYQMRHLSDTLAFASVHPVERALEAHIELVRIHPYYDGNGRAARLVQNFCLEERGYPSAIIPSTDREIYTSLLRKTLEDRFHGVSELYKQSPNELLFRSFASGKVLSSLEHLESELKKRRFYNITLGNIDEKGMAMSIKRRLSGLGRIPGREGVSINLSQGTDRRKEYVLKVIGDVGLDEINSKLSKAQSDYSFSYKVSIHNGCC